MTVGDATSARSRYLCRTGRGACPGHLSRLSWALAAPTPPALRSAWEGQTVARFAFLHPHTSINLVRQILDRMA